jgi:hypothetical protein
MVRRVVVMRKRIHYSRMDAMALVATFVARTVPKSKFFPIFVRPVAK